jgi:hypothetical protein
MRTATLNLIIPMTDIECDVEVSYIVDNDGIGAYEYWGAKCYDRGSDYAQVEDIVPVFDENNEEHREEIEQYIRDHFETLCDEFGSKLTESLEDDGYIDYRDED